MLPVCPRKVERRGMGFCFLSGLIVQEASGQCRVLRSRCMCICLGRLGCSSFVPPFPPPTPASLCVESARWSALPFPLAGLVAMYLGGLVGLCPSFPLSCIPAWQHNSQLPPLLHVPSFYGAVGAVRHPHTFLPFFTLFTACVPVDTLRAQLKVTWGDRT